MLTYSYTARNTATGEKVKSEIQAESQKAASKLLMDQGLLPIEISVSGGGAAGSLFNKVKAKDRVLFARQLSTLINAGLPLLQSLRTVNGQTENKALKQVINKIVVDVEGGTSFSEALSRHPKVFNNIFVSLIAAGEASGTLDAALERIANQQEKDAEIISKVRGAMVYPLIVVLVMVGVLGFMIISVLPQVEVLYDGLGGANQLPLITRVLLAISNFVIEYWWVVLLVLGGSGFAFGKWARTMGGKVYIDKAKMRLPPFGPLFMKVYMARFARTTQTLVASGVPLLQVMEITAKSINNVHIERSLDVASEKVKGGKALSEALTGDQNFLSLVPDMLKIGEQSGAIESMTGKVADYYEKEVDQQIKTISTIIEPMLMVMLGIVAFIIVAAVLLPIYGLAGNSTMIR